MVENLNVDVNFFEFSIDFRSHAVEYSHSGHETVQEERNVDIHTAFITNHSEHFVEARLDSARKFGYGNGSPLATMIASVASAVRRASATV